MKSWDSLKLAMVKKKKNSDFICFSNFHGDFICAIDSESICLVLALAIMILVEMRTA